MSGEPKKPKMISAEEFDRLFDEGKTDMTPYLDLSKRRRPGREVKRVNVDFPVRIVEQLDAEAARLGVTRQAIIKTWIVERLDRMSG